LVVLPSDLDFVELWDEAADTPAPAAIATTPPQPDGTPAWVATPDMVAEATSIKEWMDALEGHLTIDQVDTMPTAAEMEQRIATLGVRVDSLVLTRLEELAQDGGSGPDQQSRAVVDVLSTLRPMGAEGVSDPLPVERWSHRTAIGLVKENLWRLPTDWISRSSTTGAPMAVRTTSGAGHFIPSKHRWVMDEPTSIEVSSPWEPSSPRATDIRQRDDGTWTWTEVRRPERLVEAPEIALPPKARAGAGGVVVHEFCHRMESIRPGIPMVERAFLDRRSGGRRARPVGRKGRRYTAIDGGFVDPYVGRTYGDVPFLEVLSTGVESVHSGRWGGLMGWDGSPSDPDHRAFVLGVLAAA
jgi:hypothetical protein